ncbi:ribosomal protein L23 [Mycoplasmoides fastidiosum]|uniref:50S ribosomal protein L23 n=1 Tax=Mycoplasmoides fastidiosum TaxID=92758 RepID=A0ABU0LY74_9BACT|nr:50S ribosomal protein L23 [Mycoplasmoides fastidiosum]MDQ0513632.1 ribosomal protein L23 [Mycoplasmoides fastidiosum]UUD37948.1 50S ribosomal protein L23 [Mycoplasmoides fastidiosum]
MDLTKVILRPLNTEKAYLLRNQQNQYAFVVATKATKKHIHDAFVAIFETEPVAINTTLRKPKPTRYVNKGRRGSTKLMKIAYISVDKGVMLYADQAAENTAEAAEPKTDLTQESVAKKEDK